MALLVSIAAVGCASSAGPGAATTSRPAPASADEIEALYLARLESARSRYTEADVRFMTRMIAHHAQAIEMAELAADRAGAPAIRTLAGRIINAQTDEIATIHRWLSDRDEPVPADVAGTHAAHATTGDPMMPGMIAPEQIASLEAARGVEFDRLFLTYMIRHHDGAVEMVEELFRTDGAAQDEEVFKFASDVQVDQRTEIARMERMLSSLASGVTGR